MACKQRNPLRGEYPNGKIHGEVERFTGVEDIEEYHVWKIISMDGSPSHIDARSGVLLSRFPSRVPSVLAFETAVRIVHAPQKRHARICMPYDCYAIERTRIHIDGGARR